jgi:hypothetical protein
MHVDEIIEYGGLVKKFPNCLRYYLLVERLPATIKPVVYEAVGQPKCFATYKGERVRLVMASRLGNVGITKNLKVERGYEKRVSLKDLSDFSTEP